jgi:hypothetical protein
VKRWAEEEGGAHRICARQEERRWAHRGIGASTGWQNPVQVGVFIGGDDLAVASGERSQALQIEE